MWKTMAEVHYAEEYFTDGKQNEGYCRLGTHTKLLYKKKVRACVWTHDCLKLMSLIKNFMNSIFCMDTGHQL